MGERCTLLAGSRSHGWRRGRRRTRTDHRQWLVSREGVLGSCVYVFAPQCLSTLAVVKRETNSWRYPLLMAGHLFVLAYIAAFITYRVALALTAS